MKKSKSPVVIQMPKLTENQRALLENPKRIVYVGAGTKTGKTVALAIWIVQGLLAGERCAWIGPWYKRTRAAFDLLKSLLEVPIERQDVFAAELKFTTEAGGRIDFYSGDNSEAIYGDAYHRVVIDEASRQSEASLTAALTTISATGGKVRLAFNLERGSRNWAVRHLLRVKHMDPAERETSSEDFMLFPTISEGFVDPELIEQMRSKMPEPMWRALYLAEIPDSDAALFRDLDEIFRGPELDGPIEDHSYVLGADLARKADWTVLTVLDERTGQVAKAERFNAIEWSLQVERAKALYSKFECRIAILDATGLGDVVVEEFRRAGMIVEPFIFTRQSKKELIERLIVACEKREIAIPEGYGWLREELEAMEYQLSESGGDVRYGVPAGFTDDGVMSLGLAVRLLRPGSRGDGFFEFFRETSDDRYSAYCGGIEGPRPSTDGSLFPNTEDEDRIAAEQREDRRQWNRKLIGY